MSAGREALLARRRRLSPARGVEDADGRVGPDLQRIAERSHRAGRLENTPTEMIRWIQHPQAIVPGNVMPELGVPEQEARDMAAYLYTLR